MKRWRTHRIPSGGTGGKRAEYLNIDYLVGELIAAGRATLKELMTDYTLEEAYMMYETILVPRLNEYYAAEAAQKKRR